MSDNRLAVTALSGFLGAGETNLPNNGEGRCVAVSDDEPSRVRARGRSDDDALALPGGAKARTLAQDRHSNIFKLNAMS